MAAIGNFLLAAGTVEETGKATIVVVEIGQLDGSLVDTRSMACEYGDGTYFMKKAAAHPTYVDSR